MKQKDAFLSGEGDQWFERNKEKLGVGDDPVIKTIEKYKIEPKNILEVGCSHGWRLDRLFNKYDCAVTGIDPGDFRDNGIVQGTADDLGRFVDQAFDLVIYGWCLYLCDPEDYLKIAAEGDRVLQDEGFLIVYDFDSPYPSRVHYIHKDGLYSHHYDFSKLWLSHPAYSIHGQVFQGERMDTSVTVLKKDTKKAFLT